MVPVPVNLARCPFANPPEMPPALSVVISTLGNYAGLSRVLDTYENQEAEPSAFEVIVVADVADPEPEAVRRAIAERPYPTRLLTGHIPGLSSNRNVGWQAAQAPLVLFTDNDTPASARLVSEHLSWHRRHAADQVAVLGHVRWARELRVTPFMRWLDHGMQFDYPSIDGIEAGWGRMYGANCSLKKRFIERVGGYDEERMPYLYDDLDFAYRASKLGLRVLYNRRAEVEHLREMDLDYWRQRIGRLAIAERRFVSIHPEVEPYYYKRFSAAMDAPRASGRGSRVIRLVPRWVPVLGTRAWFSADMYFRQALAPGFLDAWNRGDGETQRPDAPVAPYLLERDAVRPSTQTI
jgi:GT2 family glycosyltransferase